MAEEEDQDQAQEQEQTVAAAEENQPDNDSEVTKAFLSLKLKNPTKDADHHQFMEEEYLRQQQQQQLGQLRTCSECGKQFTNGKALGGHKRACLQKIKNHNSGNTNQKPRIKNSVPVKLDGDEESNSNVCYVCHLSFRSVKSLYGHMRKHPDREWRGVQPPKSLLMNHHPQSASATSSSPLRLSHDGNDGGMGSGGDLTESLKGWSLKRKRGQRLIMSTSSDEDGDDHDEEESMQQAVNDLLLLAKLTANDCAAMSSKNNVSSVGSGYGVLKIKEKRVTDDSNKEDQDGDKKVKADGLGFDCNSDDTWIVKEDYDDQEDTDEMEMMMIMNQQKKNRKRRLNELGDPINKDEPMVMMATTNQTYSCPICSKVFDKHQALGGHVASHNKNKNIKESSASAIAAKDIKAEQVVAEPEAASDEETGESSRIQAAAGAGAGSSEHKCNLCNKTFPTGQALGGHKRCHWAGQAEAFSSSSQTTTSTGEVTQRAPLSHRVVHDFDLNHTPPEYYEFHGVEP